MATGNMNIITVVFKKDLGNILYQASSLKKNWQGKKEWIIVCEDGEFSSIYVKNKILPMMDGWNVIIVDSPPMRLRNWWRQQVCKLWAVDQVSDEDYSIVLDAKNFLIEPIDDSWWFVNGKQKVRVFEDFGPTNQWKQCCEFAKIEVGHIPEAWNLTPWLLKKDIVRLTINKYLELGCDIYQVEGELPAWEFNMYWLVAHDQIDWVNDKISEGMYHSIDNELSNYTQAGTRGCLCYDVPFWTFHRKMVVYPKLVEYSNNYLKELGVIDDSLINEWKILYHVG